MAAYADYTYYNATYLGVTIPEADFPRIALRASEIIDRLTYQRAADDTENETAIKNATCAVADVFYDIEQTGASGIKSEKIGDHSTAYGDKSEKTKSAAERYRDAAGLYLISTTLMYAGFKDGEYSGTYAD